MYRRFAGLPFAENYIVSDDGLVFRHTRELGYRQLFPWKTKFGYSMVTLRVCGRSIDVLLHRIVLSMFVEHPPFVGCEGRHMDANPRNNHYTNLEWGTHAENMGDMARHIATGVTVVDNSNRPRGDAHHSHVRPEAVRRGDAAAKKIGALEVTEILERVKLGRDSYKTIAKTYGVSDQLVYRIAKNKVWKTVER